VEADTDTDTEEHDRVLPVLEDIIDRKNGFRRRLVMGGAEEEDEE